VGLCAFFMKTITFNIANIPLSVKCRDDEALPSLFQQFTSTAKRPTDRTWHLESVGIKKNRSNKFPSCIAKKISPIAERFGSIRNFRVDLEKKQKILSSVYSQFPEALSDISFYFDEPVGINTKKRKIRHFYTSSTGFDEIRKFDSRLTIFAYSQILASLEGFLLHCACVVKNKDAFLFFAKSGGGKSTVAKLSRQYTVLGDDIIAVRKINHDFVAFSTPWKQKKTANRRTLFSARIKAVFFLRKSNRVLFKPLKSDKALVRFLSRYIHFFLYTERPLADKIFFTAADFFKTIPAYEMHFRKYADFWPKLEKIIK